LAQHGGAVQAEEPMTVKDEGALDGQASLAPRVRFLIFILFQIPLHPISAAAPLTFAPLPNQLQMLMNKI
tara:strand:- start:4993 stop:5202 length:210 start_codon:yes stop_codon:yes gene_type:complete